MKLGSLREGGRDGTLVVVSRDLRRAVAVPDIAPTLQAALDRWRETEPKLKAVFDTLEADTLDGEIPFDEAAMASPLPRAYQWVDGSAYINHIELVRRARGADLPESLRTEPLMYQGGSDGFLAPRDDIPAASEDWGVDFEAEVAVVTDDVPMGVTPKAAAAHIELVMLVNDTSLRRLIPDELAKGFGFLHGKPPSAFSPVAVTPGELGDAWDGARLHLPMLSFVNGEPFGRPDAGTGMIFDFPALIAHAAKTRPLAAGTIVGSGTVSNQQAPKASRIADGGVGYSCIVELRMVEKIETGQSATPFLKFGDTVRIEMNDSGGNSIFGVIEQKVARYDP